MTQGSGGSGKLERVERWDVFELALREPLRGPAGGNPFVEVELSARFTRGERSIDVAGFYDGDGTYRVRFSPDELGNWKFETDSNRRELTAKTGEFDCVAP